ncbi:hypothetical protein HPP92_013230 [Vanilla planifolia]|uniref:Uncharacterized protein n=1 Tax=Vanilla planifolia TaxID=51239 RepID=A0A835QPL4_VANPL|nr:hypothetical protein HPP92_013230 [Vanilla planifolia]
MVWSAVALPKIRRQPYRRLMLTERCLFGMSMPCERRLAVRRRSSSAAAAAASRGARAVGTWQRPAAAQRGCGELRPAFSCWLRDPAIFFKFKLLDSVLMYMFVKLLSGDNVPCRKILFEVEQSVALFGVGISMWRFRCFRLAGRYRARSGGGINCAAAEARSAFLVSNLHFSSSHHAAAAVNVNAKSIIVGLLTATVVMRGFLSTCVFARPSVFLQYRYIFIVLCVMIWLELWLILDDPRLAFAMLVRRQTGADASRFSRVMADVHARVGQCWSQ